MPAAAAKVQETWRSCDETLPPPLSAATDVCTRLYADAADATATMRQLELTASERALGAIASLERPPSAVGRRPPFGFLARRPERPSNDGGGTRFFACALTVAWFFFFFLLHRRPARRRQSVWRRRRLSTTTTTTTLTQSAATAAAATSRLHRHCWPLSLPSPPQSARSSARSRSKSPSLSLFAYSRNSHANASVVVFCLASTERCENTISADDRRRRRCRRCSDLSVPLNARRATATIAACALFC